MAMINWRMAITTSLNARYGRQLTPASAQFRTKVRMLRAGNWALKDPFDMVKSL
jgi:hypothetical protein